MEYRNYAEVVEYFGEGKVKDRFKFIYSKIEAFIRAKKIEKIAFINDEVLEQVVLDYFADIKRLKDFHQDIEYVNEIKITAYTCYWLIKRKPIGIQNADDREVDNDIFLNERFVLSYITSEILAPYVSATPPTEEAERIFLEFINHLFYHLKYREIHAQTFELMLEAFRAGYNYVVEP